MKKTMKILLFSCLLMTLSSYSQSASQIKRAMNNYYDDGDYVNASLKAIDYIRVKPKSKDGQEVLSVSFNMALEILNEDILDLKNKSKTFISDNTVNYRRRIIEKYNLLKKLDRKGREVLVIIKKKKVKLNFNRVNVTEELELAQKSLVESINLATEMHYKKGVEFSKNLTRGSQKAAAKEFKKATNYTSGYKDCNVLYETARKNATTRVAILPFDNKSGTTQFGSAGEMISDKLRSEILNNASANEFIEIYTRDRLNSILQEHDLNHNNGIINQSSIAKFGQALGVHLIITGKVMQLTSSHGEKIRDAERRRSVNVAIGTKKYIDSKGKERTKTVYGDVVARMTDFHKTATANIKGSYEVIDIESAQILASSQYGEDYKWENNWTTFLGDKRAA
ncbi:hypothetical protein, partial [Lutibacter sp.]|uniref:hypothetical protein n=1 Tax=Lutibacter sp. TaxID=1925666 RepID=UPI0034A00F97